MCAGQKDSSLNLEVKVGEVIQTEVEEEMIGIY